MILKEKILTFAAGNSKTVATIKSGDRHWDSLAVWHAWGGMAASPHWGWLLAAGRADGHRCDALCERGRVARSAQSGGEPRETWHEPGTPAPRLPYKPLS